MVVVAVPAGAPFDSARKQPSGSIARKRCQSARFWFQPAWARRESANGRSVAMSFRRRSDEFIARATVLIRCCSSHLQKGFLVNQGPSRVSAPHPGGGDIGFRTSQQGGVKHDEVGQFAGLDGTEPVVATQQARVVDGVESDGLRAGERLLGMQAAFILSGLARDGGGQAKEGIVGI